MNHGRPIGLSTDTDELGRPSKGCERDSERTPAKRLPPSRHRGLARAWCDREGYRRDGIAGPKAVAELAFLLLRSAFGAVRAAKRYGRGPRQFSGSVSAPVLSMRIGVLDNTGGQMHTYARRSARRRPLVRFPGRGADGVLLD
jgi:hypothetical protein